MTKKPTPDRDNSPGESPVAGIWFPIARALRPQGRRGELLCESLTDIEELFAKGAPLQRSPPAPFGLLPATQCTLEEAWTPQGRNAGRIVLKIAGIDSITDAEALKGCTFSVPESALPTMEDGSFLVRDLLGCTLFDGEQRLGKVTEIQFPVGPDGRTRLEDAPDLLVVQLDAYPEAEPVMIPFVKLWLRSADMEARTLHMALPPDFVHDLRTLATTADENEPSPEA